MPAAPSRLAILVPYRDRSEHLASFLPHMREFFATDPVNRALDPAIHVIEQAGEAPFNRGKLLNCGFELTRRDHGSFCLHDVDYLPLAADYRPAARPTRLIWEGLVLGESHESFFGAVTLFDRASFERVNGYSNDYWGWGYEDVNLMARCGAEGLLPFDKRDGRFRALPHPHRGRDGRGRPTREALETRTIHERKMSRLLGERGYRSDGLSSLVYQELERLSLGERAWLHRVRI